MFQSTQMWHQFISVLEKLKQLNSFCFNRLFSNLSLISCPESFLRWFTYCTKYEIETTHFLLTKLPQITLVNTLLFLLLFLFMFMYALSRRPCPKNCNAKCNSIPDQRNCWSKMTISRTFEQRCTTGSAVTSKGYTIKCRISMAFVLYRDDSRLTIGSCSVIFTGVEVFPQICSWKVVKMKRLGRCLGGNQK